MSVTPEDLRRKLTEELSAVHVDVEDTSPNRCAGSFKVLVVSSQFEGKPLLQRHSFKVLVVSSQFEGKPLLQRHRMVNSCLAEELKEIHAFEQKTLTPEQWEKLKSP